MRRVVLLALALSLAFAFSSRAQTAGIREETTARQLLDEAVRKEVSGDEDGAMQDYRMVAEQFPGTSAASKAMLDGARLSWQRGEPFAAGQTLDRLIAAGPRSPFTAAAYVLQARILAGRAEIRPDLEKALIPLRRVPLLFDRQTHPFLEARAESRFEQGEILIRLGKTAAAGASFLDVLELEPINEWKAPAAVRLGEVLAWRGDWEAAANLFQEVAEGRYPGPELWAAMALRRLELISRLRFSAAGKRSPWTAARVMSIPGGLKKPVGVDADDEGRLLIADAGLSALIVYGTDGRNEVRNEVKKIDKPWWSPDGDAFFVTPTEIFMPFQRARRPYSERDNKARAIALKKLGAGAHGAYGDIFLLDRSPSRVLRFANNRRFLAQTVPKSEDPVDIVADPRGGLLVLFDAGYVIRYDGDGHRLGKVAGSSYKKPVALTVDRVGNIYILDAGQKRIEIFGPDGKSFASVGPKLPGGLTLAAPADISVDGRGRLFVADSKSSLIVLEGGI